MAERPTFSGWLRTKRASGFMNVWKQRFFVLKDTTLYEYQTEATFSGGHKQTRRVTSVQLVPTMPLTFLVGSSGKNKAFYLSALDSTSFNNWNEAFNASCVPIVLESRPSARIPSNICSDESVTSSSTTMPVMCGDHIHQIRSSSKIYKPTTYEQPIPSKEAN